MRSGGGAVSLAPVGHSERVNEHRSESISRVLLIGLDGATWDVLRPLADAGRLPNLSRFMQEGSTGVLQSTIPPVTPAAWTSVFTGKNPGKHGIFDFQRIDPQTYQFGTIHAHRHHEKTIWQLAGEQGKRSIVVDVPFTYPPRPLNGLMLTGYGTPRTAQTRFTYPTDFAARLPNALRSEVRVALPQNNFDRSPRFIEEWAEIMSGRRALLQHLISEEAWDFFMFVFSITDNMAHVFWTYADPAHPNYYRNEAEGFREAFYHSYEQCDRLVGELMDAAGSETTTLIISDHGFGSIRPRQYLFQRLLQGGYLHAGASRSDGKQQSKQFRDALVRLAVKVYARYPALREGVKRLQPGRRQALKNTLQKAGALPDASIVDYGRSRVILSNFGLQLWLNEAGRFAKGTVSAGERAAVIDQLAAFLLADVDAVTGEPIIRNVHLGREVYEGPFVAHCPDLIVEYNNLFNIFGRNKQLNGHTEGGHTHDGILLAGGRAIATGDLYGARLIDLAPTVLHLLGLPVPPDMDGRVLEALFSSAYRDGHPVTFADSPAVASENDEATPYSDEEDADIREQLRQLGYL